jgi:predicted ATPase
MTEYAQQLRILRRDVDRKLAEYKVVQREHAIATESLQTTTTEVEACAEAVQAAQTVAVEVQAIAHQRLAEVVTRSLQAVFPDPYSFHVLFNERNNRTVANLVFRRNGVDLPPMDAAGGGVVDIASFALRLTCLILATPPVRRVLILDEPFRFLSKEYVRRTRELLETLATELQTQIIMVTHQADLANDLTNGKVYHL